MWRVALVLGAGALTGCSEETIEFPEGGQTGSDSTVVVPKTYVGMTAISGGVFQVADVIVRAESNGRELFADTLTEAGQSSFGTDSLVDKALIGYSLSKFDPTKHVVYYRNLGTPEQQVVWTATSVLNAEKVAALTDTIITVGRPCNGFIVWGNSKSFSLNVESMTIRKSQLERYFEDTRHTVRTDTLFVR